MNERKQKLARDAVKVLVPVVLAAVAYWFQVDPLDLCPPAGGR